MADLGPPVRVSPLIKFGRWSLLVAGILYGAGHQSRLAKREVFVRVEDAKKKAIRDARIGEEKRKKNEEEMAEFDRIANPKKA
ncbi:ATP synthase, subunit E [Arctopsyche grandis]|uniref:ATP synthase, subunit E n=1 Tax=Arctopsyche grandis TaxID=121162 RepID=UPI00406D67B9